MTTLATIEIQGMPVLVVKEDLTVIFEAINPSEWTPERQEEAYSIGEVFIASQVQKQPALAQTWGQKAGEGFPVAIGSPWEIEARPGANWIGKNWVSMVFLAVVAGLAWLGVRR